MEILLLIVDLLSVSSYSMKKKKKKKSKEEKMKIEEEIKKIKEETLRYIRNISVLTSRIFVLAKEGKAYKKAMRKARRRL